MSVWYCIPSKKTFAEAERTLSLWRNRGYKLAIWRDPGDEPVDCDLLLTGMYPGYANAVNALCKEVIKVDSDASWLVTGGDDVAPDPNWDPEQIARECSDFFELRHLGRSEDPSMSTFGVMQPTGDRWGHAGRAYIDHICGSPWMGREFCKRMYKGEGPLWSGWRHMFVDEELQHVATMLNVFWQRRDIKQEHQHWGRQEYRRPMPDYLREANQKFTADGRTFAARKAQGFPGHEPISVAYAAARV